MLTDYITPSDIKVNLESTEKEEAFAELTEILVAENPKLNRSEVMSSLIEREEKMSTAVFPFVAIPHAICESAKNTQIAVGITRTGIEFEPVEENSRINPIVNIIFQIIFEKENTDDHLNVLRDILNVVSKEEFHERVLRLNSAQEIYDLIAELEY